MRALVTGAGGFIGRVLCQRLEAEGWRVRALLRTPGAGPWQESVVTDLAVAAPEVAALDGVGVVFHLAARTHALTESGDTEALYHALNVEGTRRLLDVARRAGVGRVVFASSVKAMGEGGEACLDESAPLRPVTPYGRTKLMAEGLVLDAGGAVVRLPLVYGPGDQGNLARMLRAVARGWFPPLPETGNRRSLVHVADAAQALLLAGTKPEAVGEVFLVTDGRFYSTREIHLAMLAALGRPTPSWQVPLSLLKSMARLGDGAGRALGRRFLFDSAALEKLIGSACYRDDTIRRRLGYVSAWTLPEALPEMVAAMARSHGGRRR